MPWPWRRARGGGGSRISPADLARAAALEPDRHDVHLHRGRIWLESGDSALAEAAFALKPGENSAPVKGRFGTVIVHVGKIEPGHVTQLHRLVPARPTE